MTATATTPRNLSHNFPKENKTDQQTRKAKLSVMMMLRLVWVSFHYFLLFFLFPGLVMDEDSGGLVRGNFFFGQLGFFVCFVFIFCLVLCFPFCCFLFSLERGFARGFGAGSCLCRGNGESGARAGSGEWSPEAGEQPLSSALLPQ